MHFKCNIGGSIWYNNTCKAENILNSMYLNLLESISQESAYRISEEKVKVDKGGADIINIINNNELSIVIQPVVSLKTGKNRVLRSVYALDNGGQKTFIPMNCLNGLKSWALDC